MSEGLFLKNQYWLRAAKSLCYGKFVFDFWKIGTLGHMPYVSIYCIESVRQRRNSEIKEQIMYPTSLILETILNVLVISEIPVGFAIIRLHILLYTRTLETKIASAIFFWSKERNMKIIAHTEISWKNQRTNRVHIPLQEWIDNYKSQSELEEVRKKVLISFESRDLNFKRAQ